MRAGRRPQDESECVYDKPRVEGETEPGWKEEEGKGAYLEAIVTAAKLATISLPSSDAPAPRTEGRTTERRTNWRAFRRSSCCPRADSIRRLRPPRPSVGKEGERLRFSLPSPMMIRPSTISQIQTSHETFSSVEREMYTFTIFQRWSDFLQSSCNLKRRNFSLCFLLLVLPTFVRIRHSLRPELLIWSPRASPPSDVR